MANIIEILEKHASKHPDKIAFKSKTNESISYLELSKRVSSIAYSFKELGIKKNDRILIFLPFSIELYLAMFATQQLGAIAVFLDSWARKDHLGICSEIANPKMIISYDKALEICKKIPSLNAISIKLTIDELSSLSLSKNTCPIQSVNMDDTALITFTTGSSGIPKGANRTHSFLFAQHSALKQVLPYEGNEKDLTVFPIFALNNIASGITTLIPNIDLSFPNVDDGKFLYEQLLANKVDCCTLSPSLFIKIADYCNKNNLFLPLLKRVVTGGAPISKDNVENFKIIAANAKILILYGSTEVEPIAHIEADEMLSYMKKGEGVNVGPISKDLEYKIIKISNNPIVINHLGWADWELKNDKIGELIVSGPHVCKNYYNNEEAFKRSKIIDNNGKIWHRTGDLCFVDSKQFLWFVGRVHNIIKRANKLLFPVQAETILKKLPFVRQAAFIGIKDLKLGEKACAIVSLHNNYNKNDSILLSIESILKEKSIVVDQIKIIDEIPMDPRHHSKVEYNELRKLL